MKVDAQTDFAPVTLTIVFESQAEVDVFTRVLGETSAISRYEAAGGFMPYDRDSPLAVAAREVENVYLAIHDFESSELE